jgi:phosphatidate cytidylyltransferase
MFVANGKDSDQATSTPAEGVRILGAEEAQAALDLQGAEDDERRRDVGYPDQGPSWSAASPAVPLPGEPGEAPGAGEPSGEVPPLPHWTEPPTGVVPAILTDDTGEHAIDDDDLDAWSTLTGSTPRFRNDESAWADADFALEEFAEKDDSKLGALSEEGPVDEEAEFAEALAAKRPVRKAAALKPKPARAPRPEPTDNGAPPAPSGRDLPTAILSAAAVVVVAIVCFMQGTTWTAVLASLIVGVATLEVCNTMHTKAMKPATLLAFTASVTFPLATQRFGFDAYPVYFGLVTVFAFLWFLFEITPGRPVVGIATTVMAFAYVGGLGGFAGLALGFDDGVGLILGVVLCVIAYDVFGYFIGSQFGRSPIAPKISPNKTVAGTIAGMLASVAVGLIIVSMIDPFNARRGLALGVLVAIGAFLGDLCESMIKRDLGVKDLGTLLPGHGGVLDRFDGLLFCLPIVFFLAVSWNLT